MRNSTIRDVTCLDFLIKSEPGYAPEKSMRYFLQWLEQLYNLGQTERWNRHGTQKIFLRDLEIDLPNNRAFLLFYYTDGNASGASYAHLDLNTQRNESPQPREGRPESAHLLLSLNPVTQGEQRYCGLLEDSNKINRVAVQSYLNFLFMRIKKDNPADFIAPDPSGALKPNGGPQTYRYRAKFDISGHPSQEFLEILRVGRLSGISLETNRADQFSFGDGAYVTAKKKELRLVPTEGKWYENGLNRFNEALNRGNQSNYERARITFQAPDGKTHTARVNTGSGTIIGDQFIKRHRLTGFTSLLHDADEAFNNETKAKMLGLDGAP